MSMPASCLLIAACARILSALHVERIFRLKRCASPPAAWHFAEKHSVPLGFAGRCGAAALHFVFCNGKLLHAPQHPFSCCMDARHPACPPICLFAFRRNGQHHLMTPLDRYCCPVLDLVYHCCFRLAHGLPCRSAIHESGRNTFTGAPWPPPTAVRMRARRLNPLKQLRHTLFAPFLTSCR